MNEIVPPEDDAHGEPSDNKAQIARIMLLGHDLRAAVSDILGGLHLLADEELSPAMRMQFERMRAAGEDMARLIEEGFEIVTDQTVGPLRQTVQLARLLYDLEMRWTGRAQEKGLGFHVAMAPDVPVLVRLDRIALERVLSNMLSNALKYTDRGTVRLSLTVEADARLHFSVLDDGPGFDPKLRARLFRQGSRGAVPGKAGNGLGLYISRDMARRLDGRIELSNRPEGGACVALSLPLDGLRPPEIAIETPLPDLSRMTVLVAEDSALNQAVLGHMLSAMGARCDSAADGVEALEMLDNGSYDLAVVDAEMPRLSGIDLIRTLRASGGRHHAIPVVVCTAYVLRAHREAIIAAGADAIVSKPMTAIEPLAEAIRQALERHSADPADPARRPCPPVVDETVFEGLLGVAGPGAAQELLHRLIADLSRVERGLVAGLSEPNLAIVRADSHVLLSVAGAVGAVRLQELAEELCACARREDILAMQLIGRSVLTQIDRLIAFAGRRQRRFEAQDR
ncbi:hybrid sensor histidine kinase/response regulator [Rhodobacter capsulatus]|uniref:hybrid sensor histidine kinase/response regulator n=1 Tax=Rhodobacter capsulatus TaxID=1061 RepID=UPI004029B7B3